ncbi:hypothetical protein DICPUDRAFT_34947 [Dictyostelium purpureum]|uniref:LAA1-like C-terminal TPR repeats domain-containing protein n=1 Tax=Dictyostelium purpureum TaxID=5786 RepID=F0ZNM1_DICPU|nr:uncharacterized protein DICPUDRAFT_34947 [Dictyostelium purpureum]EGC34467.1 hypothetical protein DICPUDRAFT_34947 [Dictyostelium purpureum]|eukprot:XP_003289002.1 hypothetical protein DICPUDRAFT_34947 [Dictyostelium purpureum]
MSSLLKASQQQIQQQGEVHEKELELIEQYFGSLQKAVNDGIKLNNVVNKFDIVCNIVPLFDTLNKQEVDSITLKWLNLLVSCLSQGTGGPAFSLVIGNLISKLFDRSPTGSKSSTTIVKNLITQLQAKQITSQLKIKTLAIVYIQEIITLLSKMVKSSSDTFNFKASCMRCIFSCLETVGFTRGSIHVDTFKLIKTIYPPSNTTIPVGSTMSQLIDFKCECLNAIIPIVKYYNQTDNKLMGFDDKIIVFLGKHLDEDNLKLRNKLSEVLGNTFSSLYFKETSQQLLPGQIPQPNQQTPSSLSINQQPVQPNSPNTQSQNINLTKKWSIDNCLNQLNNLLVAAIKKEVRTNISMAYSKFLRELNLTDIEPLIEPIISTIFKILSTPYNKFIGNLSNQAQNIVLATPQITNEQIQFVSCVSYILRTGLGEKLSELGQQKLLRHLLTLSTNGIKIQQTAATVQQPNQPNQLNQSNSNFTVLNFQNSIVTIDNNNLNELILYCSLKECCLLINELGEGGLNNIVEDFSSQLIGMFSDRNQSTRLWSAICIRSLATHLPKNISQFLTECLGNLNSLIGEIDKLSLQPDSLKRIMNSLKGNSQGCAALLATVKTTELGVPATLLNQITKISSSLLSNPDFLNPSITLARLEAGWTIMNSLIKFMGPTFVDSILSNLFVFWKSCFNISTVHPTSERDIVIFARTRADALIPLHSLIVYNSKLLNSKVVASIVNFLGNTLKTVSELPAISTSFQPSTNELTQLLEFYLIKTFLALPAQSYASHHTTLMTIVTSLILDGPQNSMFPSLLHHDDEDILLPDLNSAFYQFELNYQIPFSSQDSSIASFTTINDCFSHGMTQFLDIRVVNSATELFSCLFISQPDRHRTQLIDHLSTCIKDVGVASPQRNIMVVNSLTAILFILKSMSHNNQRFGKSEIVATLQRFVQKYFGETNPLLRRISSECLGLLCRIEGDNVTSAIIKSLTEIIRKPAKDVATSVRAGSAFVFGCIQRSVGGMMSQKYLPTTIANLHVLAQDLTSTDVSHHALHSLFITIQTSGFDFTSFAAPTLMLIQSLLIIENPPYYLLGRIVNSIVVALGPELETSKDIMNKCTSTCNIIEKSEDPLIRAESIYFNQKLIMFAPNTINTVTLIPSLISQLKSPYLLIRVASVTCLRQLIQKRSNFEMNVPLCETIFMMMDTERDYQLQKELKLLLFTLIDTIAPNNSTSIWLKICMGIILSSKQQDDDLNNSGAKQQQQQQQSKKQEQVNDQEEDEDELDQKVVIEASEKKIEYVHRWFTKISALECVRRVISVVKNKPEHFNMVLASKLPNKNDCLVYHLHDLVSISYKAATSQIDSMRPVGILLLKDILDGFSKSIDPDYEGHLLLELYQAQIMSALRPAFAPGALPTQLSNACTVFVSFIDSAVYYDSVAIKKATALLSTQVKDLRNLNFPIYNEKTTTLVQVSILKCFAQLYLLCLKDQSLYSILSNVINPLLIYLRVHWLTFLKEYSLLSNYSPQVYPLYKPIFFSPLTYQDSIEYFRDAYPSIIKALSYLIHTPYWLIGRQNNEDSSISSSTSLKKQNLNLTNEDKEFLSETKSFDDFYLIWGLLLLPMERYLEESVDINFNQANISTSLETLSILFQFNSGENATASNVLTSNNITFDMIKQDKFKEFCQILLRINSFQNDSIQLLIIEIINNLYLNFGKDIEKQIKQQIESDSPNNSDNNLFDLVLKILLKPIDLLEFKGCKYQDQLSAPPSKQSSEGNEIDFNELKCQYFNKLIQFYLLLIKSNIVQTQEQYEKYLPVFICTIIKSLSYSNDTQLITSSIQLFNQLIKIKNQFDDTFKCKFNNILLIVFSNLINILNHNNETKQGCLLLLPIVLSNSEMISIEMFENSIEFFKSVLVSKENKLKDKVYILQIIRNVINSGSQQQQDSQIYQFSTLLLKSLLLELFNNLIFPSPVVSNDKNQILLKNEEIELNNEIIKILILSLSFSTDFSKINLFYIVISSLISFLQPNSTNQTSLHTACLQILLNFASTQQQNFKEVVSKLPIELKQQLEQSIRQNIESAAKKEIKVAPKEQIKLNFDFSKSIKE